MSFNPLISLARNAKRQRMEMQCDPQWVLDLAAERDQLRAELYDEVWQKTRDLGYGNVTDALVELERIKAAPPAAGVPEGLLADVLLREITARNEVLEALFNEFCRGGTPNWDHLFERARQLFVYAMPEPAHSFAVGKTGAPTPPASEQQNLCPHDSWRYGGGPCGDCGEVQFSEEELLRLNRPASEQQRVVVMPERGVYPSMSMYPDRKEYAAAVGEVSGRNACLDELLRLNPHLAKGEGV